jgi:cardiolipin synthase
MNRFTYAVPSLFSLTRLILSACLPFTRESVWVYLIFAAALSDFLDGWLARRLHAQSWQGGLLDAAADKIFILLTLTVFVFAGKFSFWWIFPVMIRDVIVGITVYYLIYRRKWQAFKDMDARVFGKLATIGQFSLFLVVLLFPDKTLYALIFASCCSIVAGLDYGLLFYRALVRQSL